MELDLEFQIFGWMSDQISPFVTLSLSTQSIGSCCCWLLDHLRYKLIIESGLIVGQPSS